VGGSGKLGLLRIAAEIRLDRLAILAARQSIALKTGMYILWIQWIVGLSVWHVVEVGISEAGVGLLEHFVCNGDKEIVVFIVVIVVVICISFGGGVGFLVGSV